MNESKIPVRYAKTLFLCALEADLADSVMNDLKIIHSVIMQKDFIAMMRSPIVITSIKKSIFSSLFLSKVNLLTMNFLNLLIQQKREIYIDRIIRYYHRLYNKHKGIKTAVITLPVKIDSAMREKFIHILRDVFKSEIELSEKVRPEIIGGFILNVDDEQYDASIKSSLYKLKRIFAGD